MFYLGIMNGLFLLRYALAKQPVLRRQIYYFLLFALFVFSAFRYEVGCDWSGYYFQYLKAGSDQWADIFVSREPIWWAILAQVRNLGLPYPVANIISSAVFFIGVHALARRQPDRLGFLVLLFPILIINMPMSAIRQGAAIGLLCIAFVAYLDRRPVAYALWVIVAAGFHSSALVFALLLPLTTGRYTKTRLVLAGLLAIPGAFLLATGESAEIAMSRYIDTGIDAAGAAFRVGILGLSALYFFVFVRKRWIRTFPGDYSLASIGAIAMILMVFLVPISTVIGDRIGYYLIPIQAMIFARLPYLPFGPSRKIHSALPYLGLVFVFTVWTQLSGHFQQCYIPYNSWLFGFPDSLPFRF